MACFMLPSPPRPASARSRPGSAGRITPRYIPRIGPEAPLPYVDVGHSLTSSGSNFQADVPHVPCSDNFALSGPGRHPGKNVQPRSRSINAPKVASDTAANSPVQHDHTHHAELKAELGLIRQEFEHSMAQLQLGVQRTVLEEIQAIKGVFAEALQGIQQCRTQVAAEIREDLNTGVALVRQDFGNHAAKIRVDDWGELLEEIRKSNLEVTGAIQNIDVQSCSTRMHVQQVMDTIASFDEKVQEMNAKQEEILTEITTADFQELWEEIGKLRAVHALDSADIREDFQKRMVEFMQDFKKNDMQTLNLRSTSEANDSKIDLRPVLDMISQIDFSTQLEPVIEESRKSQSKFDEEMANVQAGILKSKTEIIEKLSNMDVRVVLPQIDLSPVLEAIEKIDSSNEFKQLSSNHKAILDQIAHLNSSLKHDNGNEVLVEVERSRVQVVQEVQKINLREEHVREMLERAVNEAFNKLDLGSTKIEPVVVTDFTEVLAEIRQSAAEIVQEVQNIDVREAHVKQLADDIKNVRMERSLNMEVPESNLQLVLEQEVQNNDVRETHAKQLADGIQNARMQRSLDMGVPESNLQPVLGAIAGVAADIATVTERIDALQMATHNSYDASGRDAAVIENPNFANVLFEQIQNSKADVVEEIRAIGMRETQLQHVLEAVANSKIRAPVTDMAPVLQAIADTSFHVDVKDISVVMEEIRKSKVMHQNNFKMVLNRIHEMEKSIIILTNTLGALPKIQVERAPVYNVGSEHSYLMGPPAYFGQLTLDAHLQHR